MCAHTHTYITHVAGTIHPGLRCGDTRKIGSLPLVIHVELVRHVGFIGGEAMRVCVNTEIISIFILKLCGDIVFCYHVVGTPL